MKLISLFSGAGGLDKGFHSRNFMPKLLDTVHLFLPETPTPLFPDFQGLLLRFPRKRNTVRA